MRQRPSAPIWSSGAFATESTSRWGWSAAATGGWRGTSAAEVPRFLTWQAILSRYLPVDGRGFEAIEPMARASWGDPDRDTEDDAGLLLTPGVFLYVKGKNRIGANLDVYRSGSGDTEFSFKLQTYLYY